MKNRGREKKSRSARHVTEFARIRTSARSTPAAGGTQGVNKHKNGGQALPTYSLPILCLYAPLLSCRCYTRLVFVNEPMI